MPDQNNPLISVIITLYNREKFVAQAIESILSQTYKNWELIITDDHSTDHSLEIALQFEKKDSRIKVSKNEVNLGQFGNRNHAATLAKGKYIKYLDSDDLLYSYGLEAMLNFIELYPGAAAAISHNTLHEPTPYPILLNPEEAYKAFFLDKGFPNSGPSSAIINREIFIETGGFPKPYYVGTDTAMWLQLSARYPIVKTPPSLNWYRVHEGQAINDTFGYLSGDFTSHLGFLRSENCPLKNSDKTLALQKLHFRHARNILKLAIRPFKFRTSIRIIRKTGFPLLKLVMALFPWRIFHKISRG